MWIVIIIMGGLIAICLAEFLLEINKKNNEGGARGYIIAEHKRMQSRTLILDENYRFWDNVKNTVMERKCVKFQIDMDGYIVPSKVYENPDMKIFFLGDSTVECAAVQPENRYPFLFGKIVSERLGIKINCYNCGYSSANLYKLQQVLINKVIPEGADFVIIQNVISAVTSLCGHEKGSINVLDGFETSIRIIPRIKNAVSYCFPKIYQKAGAKKHKNSIEHIMEETNVNESNWVLDKLYSGYKSLLEICRLYDIKPILCTQLNGFGIGDQNRMQFFYKHLIQNKVNGISYKEFVELLNRANQVIRDLAFETNTILYDIENEITYNPNCIYDYIHYTDEGSILLANNLADKFIKSWKLVHNVFFERS